MQLSRRQCEGVKGPNGARQKKECKMEERDNNYRKREARKGNTIIKDRYSYRELIKRKERQSHREIKERHNK